MVHRHWICVQFMLFIINGSNKCMSSANSNYSYIDLPETHLAYYFNNYPQVAVACRTDPNCPYRSWLLRNDDRKELSTRCWGYEDNCQAENSFAQPKCIPNEYDDAPKLSNIFYKQADFGEYDYIQYNAMCMNLCVKYRRLRATTNPRDESAL